MGLTQGIAILKALYHLILILTRGGAESSRDSGAKVHAGGGGVRGRARFVHPQRSEALNEATRDRECALQVQVNNLGAWKH